MQIVATFPTVTPDGAPLSYRLATGLIAAGDHFEVLVATSGDDTTGLWRTNSQGGMDLVAALPGAGLPNGLTIDPATGARYVADSQAGVIHRIDAVGNVDVWSDADELAPDGRLGANGIKIHDGDMYAANFDRGTIVRIDIQPDQTAGAVTVAADGLAGIDDFTFTGRRADEIIAALNPSNTVALITEDGQQTLLTADDGLTGPTAAIMQGDALYVTSGAFSTPGAPNLLRAMLRSD